MVHYFYLYGIHIAFYIDLYYNEQRKNSRYHIRRSWFSIYVSFSQLLYSHAVAVTKEVIHRSNLEVCMLCNWTQLYAMPMQHLSPQSSLISIHKKHKALSPPLQYLLLTALSTSWHHTLYQYQCGVCSP